MFAGCLRAVCVTAFLAIVPLAAQVRQSSPAAPPLPTVVQPSEGSVVAGDLVISVQVPAGVAARKFATEAAYWDPVKNAWVYPGTLGADFGTGNTRIEGAARLKYNSATRWRIRVRTVDPAGGWGAWREFTWHSGPVEAAGAPPPQAAGSSATPPGSVSSKAVQPVQAPVDQAAKIAELVAECDKAIADAKAQIAALNVEIATAKALIEKLEKDIKEATAAMAGATTWQQKHWFESKIKAIEETIKLTADKIAKYQAQIKEIDALILKLQKDKAALLKK